MKYLTINDLENSGERGSVWVLNTAARSMLELSGEILINVPTAQGKNEALKIPQTWLPYDAAAKFGKKRLLDSSEFRSAVINQLVAIIDEDTATQVMSQPGAREEQQRLREREQHIYEAGAARKISQANVEITNPNQMGNGNTTPVDIVGDRDPMAATKIKAGADLNADGLKPNFVAFFNRMKTQSDIEALNALRNKGRVSRRELRYMRDNLPKTHTQTIKAIKSRLTELKKEAAAKS